MNPKFLVEVCVDSLDSAIAAVQGGANRLEICSNLGRGGGTTPSIGLTRSIVKRLPSIDVMVIIRPRPGDFLYSETEILVMQEDIHAFKQEGICGVVIGILLGDGRVDIKRTRRLVAAANGMQVTFHRAFDMTRNIEEGEFTPAQAQLNMTASALRDVIAIGGIHRILTSGHENSVSIPTLSILAKSAQSVDGSPLILPGSGINRTNVGPLMQALWPLGVHEIHLSGGSWIDNEEMVFRKQGMGMGVGGPGDWGIWQTDGSVVKEVRKLAIEQVMDL